MLRISKYKTGDCLSLKCSDGVFIAAIVTGTFKSYYDMTLIEYRGEDMPKAINFQKGKFFGTREGSLENINYLVDKCMIKMTWLDMSKNVGYVCSLKLPATVAKASYCYVNNIDDLLKYYTEELPIRIEKSKNAELFAETGFMSKHLIDLKYLF